MKESTIFKKLILFVFALVLTGVFTACGSNGNSDVSVSSDSAENREELKLVRFGYSGNNGCAAGVLGYVEATGILEEELNAYGYTAEYTGFETGGAGVNEALAAGQIEIGGYVDFPAIVGHANGIDNIVIAINDSVTGIEIVAKDDEIQTIEDLKGKKIGVTIGTVQQRFIATALESVGLTVDDVEILNMTATEAAAAMDTGDIAATANVEQYTAQLQQEDDSIHAVATTRENPEWSSPYVITGLTSFLEENPNVGVAIVKALIRGKEEAIADPENYYQILAETLGFDYELEEYVENHDNNTFETRTIEVTDDVISNIQADYEYAILTGLIENEFDVDAWIDKTYYEKAVQ